MIRTKLALCPLLVFAALAAFCISAAGAEYQPRANYGAKFEPRDKILHGAGQTYPPDASLDRAFENYGGLLGGDRYPVIFMDYLALPASQPVYDTLRTRLETIQATTGKYVVPQIGVDFSTAAGYTLSDETLQQFADGLKSLNRPVFIRPGYEFNGTWYSPPYNPTDYKKNYRLIVDKLRAEKVPAANLWCANTGYDEYYGSWDYLDDFYPGDEYVDWWSVDVFSVSDITASTTAEFLTKANEHGKPVMIGEATPRDVGANEASDWDTWFVPYFDLIKNNPGIKGMTYIDWDWSKSSWSDWGDATLETGDETVQTNYLAEMSNAIYWQAGSRIPVWAVPEPGAFALLIMAALSLLAYGWRKRK